MIPADRIYDIADMSYYEPENAIKSATERVKERRDE